MPQAHGTKSTADETGRPDKTLAEALARMLFDRAFRDANPAASAEAKRDAWKAAKAEHLKTGRYLAGRLEKAGFAIVAPAKD